MGEDTRAAPTDDGGTTMYRRKFLGGIAITGTAGLAGCTDIVNWVADQALGDVNIFNETNESLTGEIDITAPEGSSALSGEFNLEAQSEDGPNAEATRTYEDVWESAGEYRVDVQLDEGYEVRGQSSVETGVTIDDPDEQMLAIGFGAPDRSDGIAVVVATEWSGFAES